MKRLPRFSGLQVFALRAFYDLGREYMTIEEAQRVDQRPFRSLLIQKWISYRPGHGFRITPEGKAAWHDHMYKEAWRKNPALPLTSLFDPTAHGIGKVRTMPKRASAA